MTTSNSCQLPSNLPVGGQAFKPLNYSTIEQQSPLPVPKIFPGAFAFIVLNVNEKIVIFTGKTSCYEQKR
jgi:hypothetical protein